MLSSVDITSVTFCTLVEHPGGPDGGEFPQYEEFALCGDGICYYTGKPRSPTDTFCDEDVEHYASFNENDKDAVLKYLAAEREKMLQAAETLQRLIGNLQEGKLSVILEDEEDEEDEEIDEETDED